MSEYTLTGLKLGLPPTLRRFFATTNCIENLIGTLRFRRIKQHAELSALVTEGHHRLRIDLLVGGAITVSPALR